jgi:hypothetical protein
MDDGPRRYYQKRTRTGLEGAWLRVAESVITESNRVLLRFPTMSHVVKLVKTKRRGHARSQPFLKVAWLNGIRVYWERSRSLSQIQTT